MPCGVDADANLDFFSIADNISDLPNECLACIFKSLDSVDRENCSLVCRRWLRVEGQNRHRLSLEVEEPVQPKPDLLPLIPSLFTRFDAVTTLALKCSSIPIRPRPSLIGNDALILISLHCPNLTHLKLHACEELIDEAMAAFAINCKGLKELNCDSCNFGAKGMNAVLDHASSLQELSLKHIRGLSSDSSAAIPIGPGVAANSLKKICIERVLGQCFGPLIIGSKNLRTLKITYCFSRYYWDELLKAIAEEITGLVEVYLNTFVTDVGLAAFSNCCSNLEILHFEESECTNAGLVSIADNCKRLRQLHIDGWKFYNIGDEGLIAIAKGCPNLEELVLFGINLTFLSLSLLGANCQNLERLAVGWSDTFGDAEISCIADKCIRLKNLYIMKCPGVTNYVMEALPGRCSNLVKVKIRSCSGITCNGVVVSQVVCWGLWDIIVDGYTDDTLWVDIMGTRRDFKTNSLF
ncbi:F-box protein At1g47056-like [Telopea speciosissima]|uniref:F-box protein At1g47056-like n=1 Tax=Telopea speciosissima TaxID=54955 RepID=UPI001CC73CD7|nr:F-box protein At1g47056-like [Telopea speciosissima]